MVADWWPDWSAETVVIVASGPSARDAPLQEAKGRAKVIAINRSWELVPWCDLLYGCDLAWWQKNKGVPGFHGLKVTQDTRAAANQEWGLKLVRTDRTQNGIVLKPSGRLGWSGNSGFHCLNLAVQFGSKRILLVGFDMRLDRGVHWHGKHPSGLNNPSPGSIAKWRDALDAAAAELKRLGVEVINCSPVSALTAYPKVGLVEALA